MNETDCAGPGPSDEVLQAVRRLGRGLVEIGQKVGDVVERLDRMESASSRAALERDGKAFEALADLVDGLDRALAASTSAQTTGLRQRWFSRWLRPAREELASIQALSEGVRIARGKAETALVRMGYRAVDCTVHFDPMRHKAVDTAPGPEGVILSIVRGGWERENAAGEAAVRPALVIVGRESR